MNDAEIIDMLPGDLKMVAEIVGVEKALALVDRCGGSYLVIPKCAGLIREIRDNKIRALYDDKKLKLTIRDLCWKFKLSDRQISTILGNPENDTPLPLLELIEKKKQF